MKPISRIAVNSRRHARVGVTLIELMVALAITLIMMTAVITLFANLSGTVSDSRALIEISERLRATRNRLQLDLAGHTAGTIPPLRPEDGEGYLEIIEGPNTDWGLGVNTNLGAFGVPNAASGSMIHSYGISSPGYTGGTPNDIMGDADDVLMLTVRSQGEPFVGWGAYTSTVGGFTTVTRALMESPTAEVIWYAVPNGRSIPTSDPLYPIQLYTLYRRVLLVAPQLVPVSVVGKTYLFNPAQPATIPSFYNQFDLSVRSGPGPSNSVVAVGNSLTDLTNRQNRFLHAFSLSATGGVPLGNLSGWPDNQIPPTTMSHSSFPFPVQNPGYSVSTTGPLTSLLLATPAGLTNATNLPFPQAPLIKNQRLGEDVILTDVLAFDIRVFDPTVPLLVTSTSTDVIVPSDPGYVTDYGGGGVTNAGYGGFVDLGYSVSVYPAGTTAAQFATSNSHFSAYPNAISTQTPTAMHPLPLLASQAGSFLPNARILPQTYDTFSLGYEQDLIDQDEGGNGVVDEGTDGIDNDPPATGTATATPDGIVDNVPQITAPYLSSNSANTTPQIGSITAGERETMPPYPFPLRGVQITLRVYEPDTRQVRQITVVQDFLPN